MEDDLQVLRKAFGAEAESIYRGIVVAYEAADDMSGALEIVLAVRDRRARNGMLNGFQARVAAAMDGVEIDLYPEELEDSEQGPFAQLRGDIRTSLGLFARGSRVRVVDRMESGEILIQALDLNQTVFPVPEALLEPVP